MEEGLKALTIYPARICRADRRVGSLKPGKDADIAKQYPPISDSLYANSRTLDIGKVCRLILQQPLVFGEGVGMGWCVLGGVYLLEAYREGVLEGERIVALAKIAALTRMFLMKQT